MKVTLAQIASYRLAAQLLVGDGAATPADAVRHLLAMQGQDFAAVRWAIGIRSPGHSRARVDEAFNRGALVRSWPMRGTLHVLAAEDLCWMVELCAHRVATTTLSRHRQLGITEADVDAARRAATELLAATGPEDQRVPGRATRAQLMAAFEAAGIGIAGQRGVHLIGWLAVGGLFCWGPIASDGQQQLVLVDDWIAAEHRVHVPRDEALERLVRRYLRGHGPATLADLATWTRLTLGDVRVAHERVVDDLVELTTGGASHWMLAEQLEPARAAAAHRRRVLALPGYDELLLGYQRREASLDAEHADRVAPGGNGIFRAMIVVDGRICGTWRRVSRRTKAGERIVVTPEPFADLPPRVVTAFRRAVGDYAAFLGADVEFAEDAGSSTA